MRKVLLFILLSLFVLLTVFFLVDTSLKKKVPVIKLNEALQKRLQTGAITYLDINHMRKSVALVSDGIDKDSSIYAGWYVSDNLPKPIGRRFDSLQDNVQLVISAREYTLIRDSILSTKLYLVNKSGAKVCFPAEDSRIYLTLQAKDHIGFWRDIEYISHSWCANSYHHVCLERDHYWELKTPVFKGKYKTRIRWKLEREQEENLFSNEVPGYVNIGQFFLKQTYHPQNIMDPY